MIFECVQFSADICYHSYIFTKSNLMGVVTRWYPENHPNCTPKSPSMGMADKLGEIWAFNRNVMVLLMVMCFNALQLNAWNRKLARQPKYGIHQTYHEEDFWDHLWGIYPHRPSFRWVNPIRVDVKHPHGEWSQFEVLLSSTFHHAFHHGDCGVCLIWTGRDYVILYHAYQVLLYC